MKKKKKRTRGRVFIKFNFRLYFYHRRFKFPTRMDDIRSEEKKKILTSIIYLAVKYRKYRHYLLAN